MVQINSKPNHGENLINTDGAANFDFQLYLDDIETLLNDRLLGGVILLDSYEVDELPDQNEGGLIFVSNETGGSVPAFSDGTDWRRVTDREIVS